MLLRRCLMTSLFLIAAGSLALAASDPPEPWRIGLVAEASEETGGNVGAIVLQRASYSVNVVGTTAMGTIVQEFINGGETDVQAAYIGLAPKGIVPVTLEVEIDHVMVEDAVVTPAKEPEPEQGRRGRSRGTRPKPVDLQAQATKPFSIPAGSQVTVRSAFRVDLSTREGLLHLRLPEVRSAIISADAGQQKQDPATTAISGDIIVTVFHNQPLVQMESATHNILSGFDRDRTWVELAGQGEESRAFEMAFALGREGEPTLVGYAGPERDGRRDVTVVFTPAIKPAQGAVRPKQLLFVLDTSGSMGNGKLDNAKRALASCLDKLGTQDQFNLAEFDAGFTLFQPEPVQAQENLAAAHDWLKSQQAHGGTQLMPALEKILEQPVSPEHHRMIIVLSDGNLADEEQALELLKEKLGEARLFVVGIGKDVRQNTVLRLSEYGRGTAVFVDKPEELETAVGGLFDSVSRPLAWDLELDWGGAEVEMIETHRIPDLYAAQPVTVHARIRGELPAEVLLRVKTTEGTKTFTTLLPELVGDSPTLPVQRLRNAQRR